MFKFKDAAEETGGLLMGILHFLLTMAAYLSIPAIILYFLVFRPRIRAARTEGYDAGYAAAIEEVQDKLQENYEDGYAQGIFVTYIGSAVSAMKAMDESGKMDIDEYQAALDGIMGQYITDDIQTRIDNFFDLMVESSKETQES